MWSSIVSSLTGLAIALAFSYSMYVVAIEPIQNYDFDSFYNSQTKSSVYMKGLRPIYDVLGNLSSTSDELKQFDPQMFRYEHIALLPVVDVETSKGFRAVTVFSRYKYNYSDLTDRIWHAQYAINLSSMYDKSSTYNSLTYLPSNIDLLLTGVTYGGIPYDGRFNAIVSGEPNDSSLIFYIEPKRERQRS